MNNPEIKEATTKMLRAGIAAVTLVPLCFECDDSEPESGIISYTRNNIKGHVRACLLRGRSFDDTMRQIVRNYGYGKEAKALASYYYGSEVLSITEDQAV